MVMFLSVCADLNYSCREILDMFAACADLSCSEEHLSLCFSISALNYSCWYSFIYFLAMRIRTVLQGIYDHVSLSVQIRKFLKAMHEYVYQLCGL